MSYKGFSIYRKRDEYMSKRKDNKGRILKKGESQRKDGVYMYRWTDVNSERKTIYASDLNELRQQENEILIEISNGITRSDIKLNNQIELYLSTNNWLCI